MPALRLLITALVSVPIMCGALWADSCSTLALGSAVSACVIPEQPPETAMAPSLPGFSFVVLVSGTDFPLGFPVLGKFSGSNDPIFVSLLLGAGQPLSTKTCSDSAEDSSCSGGSDAISFSIGKFTVPEPGTFYLLGSGLVTSGLLGRGARRLARLSALGFGQQK